MTYDLLVVSIYGNPSYNYYEYTVQAVLVNTKTDEQEELEEIGAHSEAEARELAKQFSDKYENLAEDVWERF